MASSNSNRYKMSQERLEELKKELNYMETVREKEVSEQIKEARSFGDLSENSEYDEAKTEQGKLYSRIAEYKDLIEHAEIVDNVDHNLPKDAVTLGSIVMVSKGLIGHRAGDTVTIPVPAGEIRLEVLSVENP